MRDLAQGIKSFALDLVFPRTCFYYGMRIKRNQDACKYISNKALERIHWIKEPSCVTCSYPFDGVVEEQKQCPQCLDLKPVFDSGKALFLHQDTGRKLIHELKYRNGYYLWDDLKWLLSARTDLNQYFQGSILVPVPLHPSKLRQRGYNQSLLIAQQIQAVFDSVKIEDILIRGKKTVSQTQLKKGERLSNVKNAFALSSKKVINGHSNYIIVDDIFTTGATLNACAKVLKKSGAKHVKIFTLGHG